jgi:hypothetical protein
MIRFGKDEAYGYRALRFGGLVFLWTSGFSLYWKMAAHPNASAQMLFRAYIDARGNQTCNGWPNPALQIMVPCRTYLAGSGRRIGLHRFRIPLLYVPWRFNSGRIRLAAYHISSRFWHWVEYGRRVR